MKTTMNIRRVAVLMIAVLVFSASLLPAMAAAIQTEVKAANPEVRLSAYIESGSLKVDINITNATSNDIASGKIEVMYNAASLSFSSSVEGPAAAGTLSLYNTTVDGNVGMTFCAVSAIPDGKLSTITFARDIAASETLFFAVRVVELLKVDATPVSCNAYGTSITVADADYTVTLMDGYNNSIISTFMIPSGGNVSFPTPPTHTGYMFIGWSASGYNITKNTVITANYAPKTGNNTVQITSSATYSGGYVFLELHMVNAFENEAASAIFDISFNKALLTYSSATPGNAIVGALSLANVIEPGVLRYVVSKAGVLSDGLIATFKFQAKSVDGDAAFSIKVEEMYHLDLESTLTAVAYGCTVYVGDIKLAVAFMDGLTGELIDTVYVVSGGNATFPAAPTHEGYEFIGWDSTGTNILIDTVITAQYEEVVIEYLLGDVNNDTRVNTGDAVAMLKLIAAGTTLTGTDFMVADFNLDGRFNTGDAVAILRYVAGL